MFSLVIIAAAILAPIDDMFFRARLRAGYQHDELAYGMGTTPPRLSHMLRNHCSSFSVARLLLAPTDFVECFLEEVRAKKGCEKSVTAREVLDLIRPHMARQEGNRCDKCA